MKVVGSDWQMRDLNDLAAADRIIKMAKTKGVWDVVRELLKIWSEKHPRKWESYVVDIKDIRATRADKKFGLSKSGMLRYTLDIPQPILMALRKIYTAEELPMDRNFFLKWAREFPVMKVAEKV